MRILQVNITDEIYKQVYDLRETVLRQPIGLSLKDEDLSGDKLDTILAAEEGGNIIGCVMLHPTDKSDSIKLRQMAVYDHWQGKGIGKQLVLAAEKWVVDNKIAKIVLHARTTATGFYEGLGYVVKTGIFTEVGIPHVVMEKML